MPVNLGMAQGEIAIGTKGVIGAERVVKGAAAKMTRDLGGVGKGVGGVTDQFNKLDRVLGVGLLAGAVVGVGRVAFGLAKSASDLTESINKTSVAFASSDKEILEWSKNSAAALGQSRQQALEGASSFGLLFRTIGLAPAVTAEMSMSLVQLATDMASINNISPEEALTKLRAGLVGEIEPLRSVGVLLNAAAVEAKGLAMGLAPTTKALTEQDKVLARYQLILEQTALTQGDFARTSGELANQLRSADASAKDAEAAFGEVISKDVVEITQAYTKTLKDLTKWLENTRKAAGGQSIGEAWLRAGGWQTQADKDAAKAAKEVEVLQGFLGKANEGLIVLQDQFALGLVDDAQVQRQIQLIEEFTRAIEQASAAAAVIPAKGIAGGVPAWMTGASKDTPTAAPRFGESQEAVEEMAVDRLNALNDIERESAADRKETVRDYTKAVGDTERDYQQNLVREARDFGRQRLRAELEQLDAIADIHKDAARREADQAEDLARTISRTQADSAERIADAREDAGKRIVEMEEDFAKDRERAAEDHRDKLMSAAGRLDAIALLEERKRWARESKDAKEAHEEQRSDLQEQLDERIDDENESLAKSIANANEAHQRQLENARENDALRIEDMKADFEARKILEDEDRATRLADMAEDHANQMAEMARQHALDLQQIVTNEAEKRAEIQAQFELDLAEEIGRTKKQQDAHDKMVKRALDSVDFMFSEIARKAALAANFGPQPLNPMITPGGFPRLTAPAAAYNPAPGWQANNARTVNVHANAIQINGDGLNEREVAEVVVDMLEELGN